VCPLFLPLAALARAQRVVSFASFCSHHSQNPLGASFLIEQAAADFHYQRLRGGIFPPSMMRAHEID
jgi:hypothetical protein